MTTIVVTGGMGSGKSTLCKKLISGFKEDKISSTYLDVDVIRRNLINQSPIKETLIDKFGLSILTESNLIDKIVLSNLVFSSEETRIFFDQLIDPYIFEILSNNQSKYEIKIIEWALIAEKQVWSLTKHNVIVIDCPRELQEQRLKDGDLSPKDINLRLDLQMSSLERINKIQSMQSETEGKLLIVNSMMDNLSIKEKIIEHFITP